MGVVKFTRRLFSGETVRANPGAAVTPRAKGIARRWPSAAVHAAASVLVDTHPSICKHAIKPGVKERGASGMPPAEACGAPGDPRGTVAGDAGDPQGRGAGPPAGPPLPPASGRWSPRPLQLPGQPCSGSEVPLRRFL
jgi:hypothetical protein